MDRRVKILVAGVLLPLSIIVPVYTYDAIVSDGHVQAQATDTALNKRLRAYRRLVAVDMSKSQIERFRIRCSVAQTIMSDLAPKVQTVQQKRSEVYTSVVTKMSTLGERVKLQDIKTETYEARLAELESKIDDYNQQMTQYKQAIEDLSAMDCEADPQTFKAGLEVARQAHGRLLILVQDIRIYVNSAMKPSLAQLKESLAKQEAKKDKTTNEGTDNATEQ